MNRLLLSLIFFSPTIYGEHNVKDNNPDLKIIKSHDKGCLIYLLPTDFNELSLKHDVALTINSPSGDKYMSSHIYIWESELSTDDNPLMESEFCINKKYHDYTELTLRYEGMDQKSVHEYTYKGISQYIQTQ